MECIGAVVHDACRRRLQNCLAFIPRSGDCPRLFLIFTPSRRRVRYAIYLWFTFTRPHRARWVRTCFACVARSDPEFFETARLTLSVSHHVSCIVYMVTFYCD
jgi:hypothetical protein